MVKGAEPVIGRDGLMFNVAETGGTADMDRISK
jgi:hypothetical protein